ncbi:MAG TPA: hypothetical protein VHN80_20545, partial [Kineosporiaceae bacterium]|nr:hypothetical protein [Kineosporiaceae bacterium]
HTTGRMYLGGLHPSVLTTGGRFSAQNTPPIATAWGSRMVGGIHDAGPWRAQVISRRTASSREVQGVRLGFVPDSQRRRRASQLEAYVQAWGTAAGQVPA